jgi:hypothetical protein
VIRQISRLCRVLHRHQLPNPCSARSDTYGVLEGVCTGNAINDRQGCQPKERKPLHFEKRVKLSNNERVRWRKGCTTKKEKLLCYIYTERVRQFNIPRNANGVALLNFFGGVESRLW